MQNENRITIGMTSQANADLEATRHGHNTTDTIHRALRKSAFWDEVEASGGRIMVRRADGTLETVLLV